MIFPHSHRTHKRDIYPIFKYIRPCGARGRRAGLRARDRDTHRAHGRSSPLIALGTRQTRWRRIRSIRLLVVVDKLLDESLLEQHSDLRHLVAPQRVSQQRALDSHLNHLERAAQHAAEQAGVLELGALLWQLDEPTRGTPG